MLIICERKVSRMKTRKILCALLALVMLLASAPATAFAAEITAAEQTETYDETAEEANISGNLMNGGMATSYDGVVYYVNTEDGGCLYAEENGAARKLTDYSVQYLNVDGDGTLYFTAVDGASGLTKINWYRIATGESGTLFSVDLYEGIKNLIVQDGVCYFISNGVVCSMDLATGAGNTLLDGRSDVTAFLLYDGGYAYSYYTENGSTPIVVYQYQTMEETVVTQTSGGFDLCGDMVYFANSADGLCLYRVGLDGSGAERLTDEAVCNIVALDNKVYYKERSADSVVQVYQIEKDAVEEEIAGSCTEFTVLPDEEVVTSDSAVAELDEVETLSGQEGLVASATATSSEYKTWKQYDSRWGSLQVGTSGRTMGQIGCLVTSLAICIVHSGVRSESSFDPGVFVTAMNNNGGFTSGGELYWYKVTDVVPEFEVNNWKETVSGMTKSEIVSIISEHLAAGQQAVVNVNNGGHWVAVDSISGGNVLICDPGYTKTRLFQTSTSDSLGYALSTVIIVSTYNVTGASTGNQEATATYVTTANLNYRASPNGTLVGTLTKGATVQAVYGDTKVAGGMLWQKIIVNGSHYYVAAQYLQLASAATSLAKVTGLTAVKKTDTTLKLQFNAVVGADGYQIYDAATNQRLATCTTQNGRAVLIKTITGLNPGEKRKYKVRAYATVNGAKVYGSFSSTYSKATSGVYLSQVTGLKAIKKTETTLKLQFNAVSSADGYQIYDAETNTLLATCTTQNGRSVLTKTITGLTAGEKRKYKVRAYATENGTTYHGAFSATYTKATAGPTLAQVTGLKAIKKTETTLKLQFNAVDSADGYQIYDAETNTLLTTCTTQNGGAVLIKTVTGLNAGETRKYKARAYATVSGVHYYGPFSEVYSKATAKAATVTLVKYKVTADGLNYRSSPGMSGTIKGQVTKGTTVSVVSGYSRVMDGVTWYKIKLNGAYYYVSSDHLKKA